MIPETTKKKSKAKLIIIILVVFAIVAASLIGYLMITGKKIPDIVKEMKPEEEYTILLNQFVVNLHNESSLKNYLKLEVALMYTDEKHEIMINENLNKIRDVIIGVLRSKSSSEILDEENTIQIKKEIITDVNVELKDDIVKDVYFTDLVIQ